MENFVKMKSNESAAKYLNSGNELFEQNQFRQALILYNQSLCYAENNSCNISLAHARRSAVYKAIESDLFGSKHFFKLSHKANDKNPSIASCLQLRESEKFGRYIITDADLRVGDIIALEPLYVGVPRNLERYSRCHSCFKTNMMNLMPCSHCAEGENPCFFKNIEQ